MVLELVFLSATMRRYVDYQTALAHFVSVVAVTIIFDLLPGRNC